MCLDSSEAELQFLLNSAGINGIYQNKLNKKVKTQSLKTFYELPPRCQKQYKTKGLQLCCMSIGRLCVHKL